MSRVREPRLRAGESLDNRYTIRRLLGEGGFAEVYVAHQLHIDREVALKVLTLPPGSAADAQRHRDRFIQDARLAAKLDHPNVVTIYDFGTDAARGLAYIAMELLQGHDLEAELQQQGGLEPARALRLMVDALDALAVGHRQGIVHKDLKPANLFLVHPGQADEKVKLIDFGVARIKQGDKLTGDGQFYGTSAYLAPEYVQKQIVTPALDVYQMGLILVELLTGQTVVQTETPFQAVFVHVSGELAIPAALLEGRFGAVLRRAIARDPAERYPDAGALRAALLELTPDELPQGTSGPRKGAREVTVCSDTLILDSGPFEAEPSGGFETAALSLPPRASGVRTPTEPMESPLAAPAEPTGVFDAREPARPRWGGIAAVVVVLLVGAGVAAWLLAAPDDAAPGQEAAPVAAQADPGEAPLMEAPEEAPEEDEAPPLEQGEAFSAAEGEVAQAQERGLAAAEAHKPRQDSAKGSHAKGSHTKASAGKSSEAKGSEAKSSASKGNTARGEAPPASASSAKPPGVVNIGKKL